MKATVLFASLATFALGFSSCCPMFGLSSQSLGYRTETRQVKTCKYDTITEEIVTPASSKGGMDTVQVIEKKVPHYKTVTKKVRVSRGPCVRFFCPTKNACGSTSEKTVQMATSQGAVGSPQIGLMPTMKPIAP